MFSRPRPKKFLLKSATVLAAAACLLAFANPAGAQPSYVLVSYSNAPTGAFSVGDTRCAMNMLGGMGQEVINVDSPWVYAKNTTSNVDRQYVAWRPRLVDLTTNQLVQFGAWTPWT